MNNYAEFIRPEINKRLLNTKRYAFVQCVSAVIMKKLIAYDSSLLICGVFAVDNSKARALRLHAWLLLYLAGSLISIFHSDRKRARKRTILTSLISTLFRYINTNCVLYPENLSFFTFSFLKTQNKIKIIFQYCANISFQFILFV